MLYIYQIKEHVMMNTNIFYFTFKIPCLKYIKENILKLIIPTLFPKLLSQKLTSLIFYENGKKIVWNVLIELISLIGLGVIMVAYRLYI